VADLFRTRLVECLRKKKRGKNGKRPGPPVHDDLVRRDFTALVPNQLWLADITEHKTSEGKLYLCAVKDVYFIDSRMKSRLAVAALNNAVARRDAVAGCVLHTDCGSQGGFNRSSQHLEHGGLRWGGDRSGCRRRRRVRGGSGRRIERCDR
jgi:transposase InsO family protein